jgi:hypothetical protein
MCAQTVTRTCCTCLASMPSASIVLPIIGTPMRLGRRQCVPQHRADASTPSVAKAAGQAVPPGTETPSPARPSDDRFGPVARKLAWLTLITPIGPHLPDFPSVNSRICDPSASETKHYPWLNHSRPRARPQPLPIGYGSSN